MRLFYSGADVVDNPQADPRISLGGFLSSTVVPNDFLGNLFDDISLYTLKKGAIYTKAVFLKNETGQVVNDLEAYFEQNISSEYLAQFQIGASTALNNEQIEQIGNSRSVPYSVQFFSANGVANKVLLTNQIPIDGVIGIWIKRIIEATPSPECDVIFDDWKNKVSKEKEEVTELIFDYT